MPFDPPNENEKLKVLIACEASGTVRSAFERLGYDAWSCDLRQSLVPTNRHIVDDVRNVLTWGWHLLIVAHPPCTRLCRSGRQWLSGPGKMTHPKKLPKGRTWDSMKEEFREGVELFQDCWNAPIERVAVENPIMHDLARDAMPAPLNDLYFPQRIQPHMFGEPQFKETGLYIRGLPHLIATDQLVLPERGSVEWVKWNKVHRMAPGKERGLERSKFFPGIADAMAAQWGRFALEAIRA